MSGTISVDTFKIGDYWDQTISNTDRVRWVITGVLSFAIELRQAGNMSSVLVTGPENLVDPEWEICPVQIDSVWRYINSPKYVLSQTARLTVVDYNSVFDRWEFDEVDKSFTSRVRYTDKQIEDFMVKVYTFIPETKPKYHLPHSCNRCRAPAYITFKEVECSSPSCSVYVQPQPIG